MNSTEDLLNTGNGVIMKINYENLLRNWILSNFDFNSTTVWEALDNNSYRDIFDHMLKQMDPNSHPDYVRLKLIKNIMVFVFYSLIIFVSLFGNLLVCYIILSKRRLRTRTTNILILNLTISDLLLTFFNIPITTARLLLDNWPFGTVLCKLGPFIQALSVYVSTISMTIIAIDRYQVLVGLLRKRLTTTAPTAVIILLIWLTAGLLSIPHAVYNQLVELFTFKNLIRCRTVYPSPEEEYRKWITVLVFSTQYFIPLLIITICYSRIGLHIWRRVGIGAMTQQQRNDQNHSRRKTIKMLVTVVVVFAICWLPLNIHHIRSDFGFGTYSSTVFLICHWIAMSSVCYNPFIYFWLNKHYNESAKYLLKLCFTVKCHQRSTTDEVQVTQQMVDTIDDKKSETNVNKSGLKRTNAMKANKNSRFGNRLFGVMCVRSSISTTDSGHENNFISGNDNELNNGDNGDNVNQTMVTGFVNESKL